MFMKKVCVWMFTLFAMVGIAASEVQDAGGQNLSGMWQGALGTGAVRLHLILTFSSEDGKAYKGQLNSKDQHAVLTVENISLEGDAG